MRNVLRLIRSDFERVIEAYGSPVYVLKPGFLTAVLYRLAHASASHGVMGKLISQSLSLISVLVTGAEIDAAADIGPGLYIPHAVGVVVGPGVAAGANLSLYSGTTLGMRHEDFPTLGANVTVWTKATILGPVTIGDNVEVGAHALVLTDVASSQSVTGVFSRPD